MYATVILSPTIVWYELQVPVEGVLFQNNPLLKYLRVPL